MSLITKAQVRKALREAIARTPDAVNPSDEEACLYHKGRGNNVKRCIIGQIGHDLGLPRPPAKGIGVLNLCGGYVGDDGQGLWTGRFTPKAVDLMAEVQNFADGERFPGRSVGSAPWREIRSLLR